MGERKIYTYRCERETWVVYTRKMHYCARSDGSTCIRIRLNDKWKRTECVYRVHVLYRVSKPARLGNVTKIRERAFHREMQRYSRLFFLVSLIPLFISVSNYALLQYQFGELHADLINAKWKNCGPKFTSYKNCWIVYTF